MPPAKSRWRRLEIVDELVTEGETKGGVSVLYKPPPSWTARIVQALLLLLAITAGARVIYEVLLPLVPALLTLLLFLAGVYLITVQRGRR